MTTPLPWTEERILSLGHETDLFDFKRSAKLSDTGMKDGLTKWVGAFANGFDGHIIFGVEDPIPGQLLINDGGFPTNHKGGTREWLEDLVRNCVYPPPARMNVYEVVPAGPSSKTKAGHALYVVEVIASNPPGLHQSPDGRYHLKVGSKTRTLTHEEIIFRSKRQLEPVAQVEVRIQPHQTIDSTLIVKLTNTGPILIRDLRLELLLPPEIEGIGCFKCDESEFLVKDGFPWVRFIIDTLDHSLHKEQVEIKTWHLEFRTGITFRGATGDWQVPPSNIGYATLWVGDQPPIQQEINLAGAIIARLWFQPERRRSTHAA